MRRRLPMLAEGWFACCAGPFGPAVLVPDGVDMACRNVALARLMCLLRNRTPAPIASVFGVGKVSLLPVEAQYLQNWITLKIASCIPAVD